MSTEEKREYKCFEFLCVKFPKCVHASSCCALDDFFEDVTIKKEECFDLPDKSMFTEKKTWSYR